MTVYCVFEAVAFEGLFLHKIFINPYMADIEANERNKDSDCAPESKYVVIAKEVE